MAENNTGTVKSTPRRSKSIRNIPWTVKLLVSFVLVFGTWNPYGFHFIETIKGMDVTNLWNWFFLVLGLVVWAIFIKIVYEAIGKIGTFIFVFVVALFFAASYQSNFFNLDLQNIGLIVNILLVGLIFVGTMVPVWWRIWTGKLATDSDME